MNRIIAVPAVVVGALCFAAPAAAQAPSGGLHAGDKLVRLRAILVAPQDSSSGITPTFPGEKVKVTDSFAPEIDFTYMATDNLGFELIAATTKHKAKGKTGTTGSIGSLASTWVLPPTLTAQWHFNPKGAVRPYVGVGINYTIFYSEKASSGLKAAVGPTHVRMSDSFGPAIQAGVDVDVGRNVFLNLDVKWIDIDTKARLATTAIGTQTVKVHIDPIVAGVGIGMKF